MDILEGIKRIRKNLESETDADIRKDLKAVMSGMSNFYFRRKTKIARERYEKYCRKCEFFKDEPIDDMKINDKLIPELSGKMCGYCGCVMSYKIRQSIKKCQYWK